ncbi:MAG: transporter substrate-binding domain-containing protein [Halopseudomonas aestusnigri]
MHGKLTVAAFTKFCLIVMACFILFGGGKKSLAQSRCEFTLAWENYPPFIYLDEQQHLTGFDVEVAEQAFTLMGCDAKWLEMPWARALVNMENGHVMVLASANMTSERKAFSHYSIPYRVSRQSLFLREGSHHRCTSLTSCIGNENVIGIQRSYLYGAPFDDVIHDNDFRSNFTVTTSMTQSLKQLHSGRIDGLIGNIPVVWYLAEQVGVSSVLYQTKIKNTAGSEQHFMFSKKATRALDVVAFNAALKSLQVNGVLDALKRKYRVE